MRVLFVVLLGSVSMSWAGQEPNELVVELGSETVYGQLPQEDAGLSSSLRIPVMGFELPMSVSSLSSETMARQGNQTIREALQNFAGVTTASGNGVHDFFVMRGIDSLTGSAVYVDRVLEPEAGLYPLYNIEEVQVLKGPSAFLFGASNTAGGVNLVRKTAQYESFGQLNLEAGSFDTYRQSFDINRGDEGKPLAFRINGLSETSRGYRDDMGREVYGVNPSLIIKPNETETFGVQFDFLKSRTKPDAGIPVVGNRAVDVPRSRSYQESDDFSDQETVRFQFDYERHIDETTSLQNKAYYTNFQWDTRGVIFAGVNLSGFGPTALSRYQPRLDDEQSIFGNQLELLHRFNTGDLEHEAIVGLEVTRFTDEFTLDVPAIDEIDIFTQVKSANLFLPDQPSKSADTTTDWAGLYLTDHLKLDERWSLLLGGRVDWMDFEDDENDLSRSETLFSPRGGLVYKLSPTWATYFAGGIGYAPPSSLQRAEGASKPEKSELLETGLKYQSADKKWGGQIATYRLDLEDVPVASDASGVLNATGDKQSRGLEVEVTARPREGLSFLAAYTYLDSELVKFSERGVDRDGQTTPYAARHVFQAWTDLRLKSGLGFGAGFRNLSSQFIAPDNVFKIGSYFIVDSAIYYQMKNKTFSLNFYNMTNERYFTRGSSANNSVIPDSGFTMMGRMELLF